ncbi:MAG TPA: hypothetical protein VFN31_00510 [Candidatus Saccharimonadales bacterium]|nr:hypothetical protein [Candidatus Saccharimonadales bacterium]
MAYVITGETITMQRQDESSILGYGFEIKPPLMEKQAENICELLTRYATIDSAYVTRNDEDGTALVVATEFVKEADSIKFIGQLIRYFINPADQQDVTLHV